MDTPLILEIADFVGIVSFALSGFLVGARHRLDVFGVALLAFLTALGGGVARDVIVGSLPSCLKDLTSPILVLASIVAAVLFGLNKKSEIEQRFLFVVSDAVGLVAFSISGSLVAIGAGLNLFGVAILSLLTAVGGGMIRDILVNDVPVILKSEFYATIAIVVGVVMYLMKLYNVLNLFSILLLFCFSLALRLVAYRKNWHLPKLKG